jgi:hypothetical protein
MRGLSPQAAVTLGSAFLSSQYSLETRQTRGMMSLCPLVRSFVAHFGEMGSRWGINRTVGQIYALIFASPTALNAAELACVALHRAVGLLDHHRHHVQHAVHVDTGHAPVQGSQSEVFHVDAPVGKVPSGTQGDHRFGRAQDALDRGLEDSSNRTRFGPLYHSCCNPTHAGRPRRATVGGSSQPGGDPVRRRDRAFTRKTTSIAQCGASHRAPIRGFHAPGRCVRIMRG